MRFHSAPVIRLADAKPVQLGHVVKADGRWRLFAFATVDDVGLPDGDIAALCDFLLNDPHSPVRRYTPDGVDVDSIIDMRAVFQQSHRHLALEKMPHLLLPAKGRFGLIDYEKIFCPDLKNGQDIFNMRGIDRQAGAIVVVRPDQFVASIMPLQARESLTAFFDGFMVLEDGL
jgi:phenol 2-monooxygenase